MAKYLSLVIVTALFAGFVCLGGCAKDRSLKSRMKDDLRAISHKAHRDAEKIDHKVSDKLQLN